MSWVTVQLKNAKSSETGPQAFEQVLLSLPKPHVPLLGLVPFLKPDPIAFEIVCLNQVTSFQVSLWEDQLHYLKAQLVAAYPEITIVEAEKDRHTLKPFFDGYLEVANLKLAHGSYYPIRTYHDFSDTDPLSAVLGTLSKLQPGQSGMIQLLVAPTGDGWKAAGYKLAQGTTNAEGKTTPHPYQSLIEEKLAEVSHLTAITLAASASSKAEAQAVLAQLVGSFAPIADGKSNSLVASRPVFGQNALKASLPHRNFHKTTPQYFSVSELATMYHLPYKPIKDIKNIAWGKTLLGEPPESLPTYQGLDEAARAGVNFFGRAEFKNEEQVFGIKDEDRRRHMYIIGKSGTGKSTLLGNMIVGDIKRGKGVAVIDPHGDLIEFVLDFIPSNRINDVVYLNPADPEYTVRINLLEHSGHQFKELIASGIISIFKKLYAHSWGPRLEYILRNTVLTLIEKDQATMGDIVKILTNKAFRERTAAALADPVLKNFWEKEFATMGDRMQSEAVSPILNKIGQFVSSPLIRHVINSPTSSFSIEDSMNQGKILLCNLSQGKLGEDNAAMLGAMLITKIQLAAMNRVYMAEEDRKDFYLYVDEFQNFATSSFIKILSEARKYRLNLILANQYVEQIEPDIRSAIFGNCGTLITFLVGAQDAALLSQEFGQQYLPEDLVSIGKHQIVLKLMVDGTQSHPFPAWTLPPASNKNSNRSKVIKVSNERHARRKVALGSAEPSTTKSKTKSIDQTSSESIMTNISVSENNSLDQTPLEQPRDNT